MEISDWISGHFNPNTDISLHFLVLRPGSLDTQYPVVLAPAYVFLFKRTQRRTFIQIYCLLQEIFGGFFFSQDNAKLIFVYCHENSHHSHNLFLLGRMRI